MLSTLCTSFAPPPMLCLATGRRLMLFSRVPPLTNPLPSPSSSPCLVIVDRPYKAIASMYILRKPPSWQGQSRVLSHHLTDYNLLHLNKEPRGRTKYITNPHFSSKLRALVLATGAMGRKPSYKGEDTYLGQGTFGANTDMWSWSMCLTVAPPLITNEHLKSHILSLTTLITHHAPRITHHAPRTTHHAPRTTRHAPLSTATTPPPVPPYNTPCTILRCELLRHV